MSRKFDVNGWAPHPRGDCGEFRFIHLSFDWLVTDECCFVGASAALFGFTVNVTWWPRGKDLASQKAEEWIDGIEAAMIVPVEDLGANPIGREKAP